MQYKIAKEENGNGEDPPDDKPNVPVKNEFLEELIDIPASPGGLEAQETSNVFGEDYNKGFSTLHAEKLEESMKDDMTRIVERYEEKDYKDMKDE